MQVHIRRLKIAFGAKFYIFGTDYAVFLKNFNNEIDGV